MTNTFFITLNYDYYISIEDNHLWIRLLSVVVPLQRIRDNPDADSPEKSESGHKY